MTTIAVTGATGFVGGAIATRAAMQGHDVIALSRRPDGSQSSRFYDLAHRLPQDVLRDVDVVVHCAYDLALTRPRDIARVNVEGTRRLVEASVASGARFVLISSMSAYPGTRQIYGRAKLASERIALGAGGAAVRLGLVYGDNGAGMIGVLRRLVALPVTPLIGANAHQFTVHVEDMADGILRLSLNSREAPAAVGLAHPHPVRFKDILSALAHQSGTQLRTLPAPWPPVYFSIRAAESLGVSLPLRADSVLGLVRAAPSVPHYELWSQLGLKIRSFAQWNDSQRK